MGTGLPGGLVDREIGRHGECRCHAAQPETLPAVSPQGVLPGAQGTGKTGFAAQYAATTHHGPRFAARVRPRTRPRIGARPGLMHALCLKDGATRWASAPAPPGQAWRWVKLYQFPESSRMTASMP